MVLVLTRRTEEALVFRVAGEEVTVRVLAMSLPNGREILGRGRVKLGIEAPESVQVLREGLGHDG